MCHNQRMERTRLEMLEQFVKDSPKDSFCWYGLALEYKSLGRIDEAVQTLKRLVEMDPDYSSAFLQLGNLLRDSSPSEAKAIFQRGVQAAQRKGEWKNKSEMEAALQELES